MNQPSIARYPLATAIPELMLAQPHVGRDAAVSVGWLEGEVGKQTLLLMGNTEANTGPTTLKAEQDRINGFLSSKSQITWTLLYGIRPVGAVWVNLEATKHLQAPSVHIMIGDPNMRGKGLGSEAVKVVCTYIQASIQPEHIYSRYLLTNKGSAATLKRVGFTAFKKPYTDEDGLEWQNVRRVCVPANAL